MGTICICGVIFCAVIFNKDTYLEFGTFGLMSRLGSLGLGKVSSSVRDWRRDESYIEVVGGHRRRKMVSWVELR